jgi:hypothetical protein
VTKIDALARQWARAQEAADDSAPVTARRSPETGKLLDRFREAASDYLAERLMGSSPIAAQRWSSASTFLPADVAGAITRFNDMLNERVADRLQELADTSSFPDLDASVVAGVGADMILQPITRPLTKAVETLELVGLAIGFTVGAPALIVVCAKGLLHQKVTDLAAKVVGEALSPTDTPTMSPRDKRILKAIAGQATPASDATSKPTPREILEETRELLEETRELLESTRKTDQTRTVSPAAQVTDDLSTLG